MVGKRVFVSGFAVGKTAGDFKAQLAPRKQPGNAIADLGFIIDDDYLIHRKCPLSLIVWFLIVII